MTHHLFPDAMSAQNESYFSARSLQGYAGASIAVTVITNSAQQVYHAIAKAGLPDAITVSIALVVSFGMVLIFAKRPLDTPKAKFACISFLNALLLFHTNLGVSTVLYNSFGVPPAERTVATTNASTPSPATAGLLEHVKALFVPASPWIGPELSEVEGLRADLAAIKEDLPQVVPADTIDHQLAVVMQQQQRNVQLIDSLNHELLTVRSEYQASLEKTSQQAEAYDRHLSQISQQVHDSRIQVNIEALRNEVQRQQNVQQQQQQHVQQQQQQQLQQQQVQQLQQQKQQQQQQQLILHMQQQQQQLSTIRSRIFRHSK